MPQSVWTPFVQVLIAVSALCVSAAAAFHIVSAWNEDKNARLVEIGVAILRADPKKETSSSATREWALDLIDANAGGVKFSPEARAELLKNAITAKGYLYEGSVYGGSDFQGYKYNSDSLAGQKPEKK